MLKKSGTLEQKPRDNRKNVLDDILEEGPDNIGTQAVRINLDENAKKPGDGSPWEM